MTECPQWRLRSPHYLNVPGTTYEQVEVSRETGKQARKSFTVPRLLNPEDPNDCNRDGECVVYHAVDGARAPRFGHEFVGDPTPEMEPLNGEAEAIQATFEEKWSKPFTEFNLADRTEGYFDDLTRAIEAAINKGGGRVAEPNQVVVSRDEFETLKRQLAELQAKAAPAAETERRV